MRTASMAGQSLHAGACAYKVESRQDLLPRSEMDVYRKWKCRRLVARGFWLFNDENGELYSCGLPIKVESGISRKPGFYA